MMCVGMAAQGAEVVFGDLDDIDSLKRGFTGAYGVYGITDCEYLFGQLVFSSYFLVPLPH